MYCNFRLTYNNNTHIHHVNSFIHFYTIPIHLYIFIPCRCIFKSHKFIQYTFYSIYIILLPTDISCIDYFVPKRDTRITLSDAQPSVPLRRSRFSLLRNSLIIFGERGQGEESSGSEEVHNSRYPGCSPRNSQ